jgi:hypothetical protein
MRNSIMLIEQYRWTRPEQMDAAIDAARAALGGGNA